MQDGKIILVNTAKDLLKRDGSQLFGRFFIALLAQATLERSTVAEAERAPTLVYVDEAQEYFDDTTETILNQARKYKVGLTLAHQTLDQLSPRLRSVIHANTSLKCAGGVSAKDARSLADELHTTSGFIEDMRRRGGRTEFAVWLKNMTAHAIRLSVPLGFLERQPILTEEHYAALLANNRERYCGTLDDVLPLGPTSHRSSEFTTEAMSGFTRVWAIAPDAKRRRAVQQAAEAQLAAEQLAVIEFLTTADLIEALDGLVLPEPAEEIVKGYKVKTTRKIASSNEAKDRRAEILRILANTKDQERS